MPEKMAVEKIGAGKIWRVFLKKSGKNWRVFFGKHTGKTGAKGAEENFFEENAYKTQENWRRRRRRKNLAWKKLAGFLKKVRKKLADFEYANFFCAIFFGRQFPPPPVQEGEIF